MTAGAEPAASEVKLECPRCGGSVEGVLVGTREVSDMLGLSRQRVQQLAERADFPAPAVEFAMGRVWLRADIDTWVSAWRAER